jgi:hypothetical protein
MKEQWVIKFHDESVDMDAYLAGFDLMHEVPCWSYCKSMARRFVTLSDARCVASMPGMVQPCRVVRLIPKVTQ